MSHRQIGRPYHARGAAVACPRAARRYVAALFIVLTFAFGARQHVALAFTPPTGSYDARATAAQICTLGFARRHRRVPYRLRDAVYRRYGLPRGARRGYVIDHLVPLELGGRNDLANLRPQTRAEAHRKDRDENRLHEDVCTGRLSLDAARREMLARWRR